MNPPPARDDELPGVVELEAGDLDRDRAAASVAGERFARSHLRHAWLVAVFVVGSQVVV
jgi:hypothetical protein